MIKNMKIGTKIAVLIGISTILTFLLGRISGSGKQISILPIVLTVIIFAVCFIFVRLIISKPLKNVSNMVQELSMGHLKARMKVKSYDEVGRMASTLNELADTLQINILGSLKQIAEGDMNVFLDSKDESDEITPVVMETAATVKAIVDEDKRHNRGCQRRRFGQALQ